MCMQLQCVILLAQVCEEMTNDKMSGLHRVWCCRLGIAQGYIIHMVFLVTLLILNRIGQDWLHTVSCDWSTLKIHFHKMEYCYSWATALITCQTVPQICQNNRYCHMDHVKQLVTTFAILVERTHPMRRWQTLYESVRNLHSRIITCQHSTSGPVPDLDTDTNLIHNS